MRTTCPTNDLSHQPPLPEETNQRSQGGGVMDYILDLRQRGFTVYASLQGLFVTPRKNLSEQDKATIRARKWEMLATVQQEQMGYMARNTDVWMEIAEDQLRVLHETERKLKSAEGTIALLRLQILVLEHNATELDDALLKKVRYLTHPDKHGGSEVAREVFMALQRIQAQRRARA
jgi:hypothetical protein